MSHVTKLFGCALAVVIVTLGSRQSRAEIVLSIQQVGANVVVTGSGTANITGLTLFVNETTFSVIAPAADALTVGPSSAQAASDFSGVTGPSNFGSGGVTFASSGTGERFGLDSAGATLLLQVPQGYASGAALAGTGEYDNKTLNSLGLTTGTYTYLFGAGATADSLVIQVGPAAAPAPLPSTVWAGLGLLGCVGTTQVMRRRKAVAA